MFANVEGRPFRQFPRVFAVMSKTEKAEVRLRVGAQVSLSSFFPSTLVGFNSILRNMSVTSNFNFAQSVWKGLQIEMLYSVLMLHKVAFYLLAVQTI